MGERTIIWVENYDACGNPVRHEVGIRGVRNIYEHPVAFSCDKWYYDVIYDDKNVLRVFNPINVYFHDSNID